MPARTCYGIWGSPTSGDEYVLVAVAELRGEIFECLGKIWISAFILGRVVLVAKLGLVGDVVEAGIDFEGCEELLDPLAEGNLLKMSRFALPHLRVNKKIIKGEWGVELNKPGQISRLPSAIPYSFILIMPFYCPLS